MEFIKANPREYDSESNDCTVRATSLALSKPYKEVHKVFASNGRRWGKGVNLITLEKSLKSLLGTEPDTHKHWLHGRITLKSFVSRYNKGSWVVVKRGHAFAVVDGVVMDAHNRCCGSRSIVQYAYKVN
jgi:hypothetical protein